MHDPYFLECMLGEDLEKIGDKPIIKIFHSLASPGTSKEDYQLAIQGIDLGTELWWANKLSAPGKTPIISLPGSDPAAWISTHLGE